MNNVMNKPVGATRRAYDPKCYDLALYFLHDLVDLVPVLMADDLAHEIQQAVEDWIEGQGMEIKARE